MNFKDKLTDLINRYNVESGSDTPDFILAQYLQGCLDCWNDAILNREKWYGRKVGGGVGLLTIAEPGGEK